MNGHVCLITGGAGGIGAAVARQLAGRGMRIVVADLDHAHGTALANEVGGLFVPTDVRVPEHSDRAVAAALEAFGRLDIAVLNAGVPGRCGFDDFTMQRYRDTLSVNVDGVVHGIRACLPPFRSQAAGSIIVTASLAALTASPDPFYAASKHAIVGLVRSAAMLLGGDGVRINALCPGLVDTPLIAPFRTAADDAGLAVAEPTELATAVETILADDRTGRAWIVQAGHRPTPVTYPDIQLATTT